MNHFEHLLAAYPRLSNLLQKVPAFEALEPQAIPIPEAITKIVVGQMLSRTAADAIYHRLTQKRTACQQEGAWQLSEADLLGCGLSRRKVRTIREFADFYERDQFKVESWRNLDHEQLRAVVSEHWGLSHWSADMLAIFHFAMPDVFPENDGAIIRVRQTLEKHYLTGPLEPEFARPYRTSLARYMWALLDRKILSTAGSN
ncbi:DNA-3-methyladenine glycosylase family protein [Marinospirillum perlucidum]|uniref:DNA-3-methyladenine glycosylase family protein n=1 Tax=Marinospirillum perlucidum TaxID=1982602 RepID=UPI000DF2CFDF|nr:hypothetical protein [Marinospirillum perlucidum]